MTKQQLHKLTAWWHSLSRTDRGASMVEYALLVVLIAILGFVAVQLAGDTLSDTYGNIAADLQQANAN